MNHKFNTIIACGLGLSLMVGSSIAQATVSDGIYDLKSGIDIPSQGTVFNQSLHEGYSDLSVEIRGLNNSSDAELFNYKARLSALGSPVDPEEVMDRPGLEENEKPIFQDALFRLYDAYAAGSKEFAPALSATAQVSFDCWIEATEDGADIYAQECKNRFEQAIANAKAVSTKELVSITISPPIREIEVPIAVLPEPEPIIIEEEPVPVPQAVLDQYITIPFEFDKTIFAPGGEESLQQALEALNTYEELHINLIAHADRAGSEAYNKALSKRRADVVLDRLIKSGVSSERLKFFDAVGETQSLVPTEDGVPLQENRVVELDLVNSQNQATDSQ